MPFKNPHPLYSVWRGMMRRCYEKNFKQFNDYGGRGISVCERWKTFSNFAADMGDRPVGHSIERKDNNGGYESSNCKWASKRDQQRNQRVTRKVKIEGIEYLACELAEIAGVKTDTIIERAERGLSYKQVICKEKLRNDSGLRLGGFANGARQRELTQCVNGHEFTPENTSITKEGWRRCRRCHADRELEKRRQARIGS
jgi:hypothetical protein